MRLETQRKYPSLQSTYVIYKPIPVNSLFIPHISVLGACTSQRVLMLPWLAGQGLLALLLACLALYYLVLYPDSNCYGSNAGGDCTLLLWHSVIMVLSLMLLVYYIYIVSEFVGQGTNSIEKKIWLEF